MNRKCSFCDATISEEGFCSACGASAEIELDYTAHPRGKVVGERASLAPIKCVKCGHRQHNSKSCDRCGLVFARITDGNRPWEQPPSGKEIHYKKAEFLWKKIEASPNSKGAHDEFCAYCRNNNIIELASRRYRFRLSDYPNDALAQHYNKKIVQSANKMLKTMKQRPTTQIDPQKLEILIFIMSGIIAIVILLSLAIISIIKLLSFLKKI